MANELSQVHFFEFGPFRLDASRRLLYRNGDLVPLPPKALEILAVLIERPREVLTKDELMRVVWPDTYVEESNLAHHIALIRKTLEDGGPRSLIETIPKRGYRFAAEVKCPQPDLKGTPQATPPQETPRRRVTWVLAAAAFLAAAGGALWTWRPGWPSSSRIESLAVLTLENLSGDSAQDYFADAMTEALIIDLSKIGTLKVVPRSAVKQYKQRPLAEIARELKVDALVEGSVLRSPESVRITAQLIHPATGRNLWAESYERPLQDIVNLQREIARAIAGEVGARATGAQHLAKSPPVDPVAYDLYLQGKSLSNRRIRVENQAAIQLLERAVAKDPAFAPAYAALALAYIERFFTFAPEEQQQMGAKAGAAIDKAISLDPVLPEAYVARGRLSWSPVNRFSHQKAIQDFRRALALNPSSVQAHWWLGAVYSHTGLIDQAFREAQMATDLNPAGSLVPYHLVEPLLWQGKYERALEFLLATPREARTSLIGSHTAWALFQLGRKQEASATVEQFLKDYPDDLGNGLKGLQALLLAGAGEERKAEDKIKEAISLQNAGQFHHTAFHIASAYALLNRPEPAVRWLEHAADNGFPCYPLFERASSLDPVRKNPRFIEFMGKMKKQWESLENLTGRGIL